MNEATAESDDDAVPQPPPPVAVRVARALGAPGEGAVAVSGELPAGVRGALPADVRIVAAEAGREPDGAAPHTALLVLDGAVDGPALERRLGTACRRFPGRLLVWQRDRCGTGVAGNAGVPVERFFAFGFRRVFAAVEDELSHTLHEYRLADYKQPPDWLNARFWANPERFGADPDEDAPPAS